MVELLTALTLSTVVAAAVGSLLVHQASALTHSTGRVDRLEAARSVHLVLRSELQSGRFASDWSVVDDTIFLRAFRGTAVPCGNSNGASGGVSSSDLVWIRGIRRPEPRKDSLLILDSEGRWHAGALADVLEGWGGKMGDGDETAELLCAEASNSGEGWVQEWNRSWGPTETGLVLGRIFERGSYHLADGAFRYRIGRGGRQPLTPELLDTDASSLSLEGSIPRLVLRIRFPEADGPGSASVEATEVTSSGRDVDPRIWFPEP